ncbi:MAG TPA: HEAT repeat domain-containing protein [Anaeromyxobacteraceae bacterium]|nr:HEAT repeat domain-containing protein [Anaeromyxobacteraceae bacterium]
MRAALRTSIRLAALLLAAAGCGRSPVNVESVQAAPGALGGPLREAGLDPAALEGAARDALGRAGFRLGTGGKRSYRARVDVLAVRVVPGGGRPRVEVALAIELAPLRAGDALLAQKGVAESPLTGSPDRAWKAAVEAAATAAAEGLWLVLAEQRKGEDQLLADLSSKDARVREQAVRILGERGAVGAVPALVARLEDEDPEVVHRAVGALAQIGDRRAVKPLIVLARGGEAPQTARLARIIGDIGGPEAEGYLLTLESGHPDARVRRAAREALAEMEARADGTSSAR